MSPRETQSPQSSAPLDAAVERPRAGVSRRTFVAGTAAAGAALAAVGLAGCGDQAGQDAAGEPQVITDASKIVNVTEEYQSVDATLPVQASWDLPLGTVVFHCEGAWAALLQTPESARAVNRLGIISLASGAQSTLVADPTQGQGMAFHDVRCSESVYAWVEMDYATGAWALLAAPLVNGQLSGDTVKLDEGDADWEPPRFTASGDAVIWQKMPLVTGSKTAESSHCYRWRTGGGDSEELLESPGRFATWPHVSDGILTVAPRVNADEGVYYGITAMDLADKKTVDQLVMPSSVSPFEAVYMGDSFAFSVEANYESGGSLGKMGTFIGREGGPFVYLSREPLSCVAGSGSRYLVKAQSSHFLIDTEAKTYGVIAAPDKSLEYGDYPASEGTCDRFVTYATVRGDDGLPSLVRLRVFSL